MATIKVLQVVGYKNSGKTTLMNQLVKTSKQLGLKVVTIKHHGHHHPINLPNEHVDSMQYLNHGADRSIVYGGGMMQLHDQTIDGDQALENMLAYAKVQKPDVILIEGFKQADFPKVVISRDSNDWSELVNLRQIELLVTVESFREQEVTVIPRHDQQEIINWYKKWLGVFE